MENDVYVKKSGLSICSIYRNTARFFSIVGLLLVFIALSQSAYGQLSGTVYRDFNEDGVRSFTVATPLDGEIGVGGITVNVYNNTGLVGSTITSSATATAGFYTITPSGAGPYRVEFSNLPAGYYDGLHGTASGTSTQFVASSVATEINLGINYPFDYCQAVPVFFVPCYVNGNPLGSGSSGDEGVFVTLPYNATSAQEVSNTGGNTPSETAISLNRQLGTVYGVAYQRATKYTYTSAFVKRHSGLADGGAGGIYITKPSGGATFTTSLFTTLPTAVTAIATTSVSGTVATTVSSTVGSNTDRGLPAVLTEGNRDATTFDLVGKAGLGDLEISEDGTQLYVVNLGDRRLYQIPIIDPTSDTPTAGTAISFTIPSPSQQPGSVFRPFGLKYYRGRVYVGGVTSNEGVAGTVNFGIGGTIGELPSSTSLVTRDTTGMKAVVYEFNPNDASFTSVLSFPLTYQKGATNNDKTGADRAEFWLPWVDAQPARFARNDLPYCSYPQPMLTGIEFDVDGSMILSIRDRFGDQYGNNNLGPDPNSTADPIQKYRAIAPGDILRAGRCTAGVNEWTLEYNASVCNGLVTSGANTTQGPGNGEYYYSDHIEAGASGGAFQLEMSEGGLALLPGSGEVASIVLDPTYNVDSGGIRRFKNSDGSSGPATSVQIYRSDDVSTYGKANGLGDLELGCDLPPIQIGNRVWRDTNNNGIQDPDEPGFADVQVALLGPGSTTIATVTTNADGDYYFSTAVGTNVLGSVYNLTLTPGGSYTLSFPVSVSAFTINTVPASGTVTNAIDSDPDATGSIAFTLGQAGQNNFTYDAGYVCAPLALSLTSAEICVGQTVNLTATAGFSSYTFSSELTQLGTTNVASGSATGTYSVTAVNSAGCSGTATGTITVNPNPVITLTSVTICAGETATLTATAGLASYSFSTGLTQLAGTNIASTTEAGTYSVTAATAGGCSAIATGSVTVNPIPVVELSSMTICAGQTAILTATAGFADYNFSPGLTRIGTTNEAIGTTTGTYSVTAINSVGCSSTATGSITANPLPVVALTSATICEGQTASLTATAGYDIYLFSTGLTQLGNSNVAIGTTDGIYSVTAISAEGCVGTGTGSITINANPVVSLSSDTICAGQQAVLVATGGYTTYQFSSGLTQVGPFNVATGTAEGTYSVTAISSDGCSGTATGTITVNPLPVAAITGSSATICEGQSATLTASGGDTYLWSTGEQTASIVVTTSDVYSVTVSTEVGCSAVASTMVTVNPLPVLTVNSETVCSGQSATLTVAGCEDGTILWSTTETTATILVSPSLTTVYTAICAFTTGCSSTISTTVTVNEVPSYTALPQAVTATCVGLAANNDAHIDLTTLQNTELADIVAGNTYGSGPAYGDPTNLAITAGAVSFTNLPNPAMSQPYTIRLYSPGGACYTDVTVILEPATCTCPAPKCIPLVIQKSRTASR
ncbi:hypothetical protein EXU85_30240 [Spirosoma sp. KCTC 42546]|uniref:SdrD B-like domain-containing protein n=1 Tax=Spirosoma sp. KCTC 42546 TaxID=2520506 RepID=UPI00115C28A4|nr:SdrD B-like domain-containing protein [Spirosoma sp. KCTC 42546]QDK82658.1 hypothetical protein EXU85_30240 [Spirosoma sp. KCTC 42546]